MSPSAWSESQWLRFGISPFAWDHSACRLRRLRSAVLLCLLLGSGPAAAVPIELAWAGERQDVSEEPLSLRMHSDTDSTWPSCV